MQKYPWTTAVIEGHTDNVGGYDYNLKLSYQRAANVVDYLVEHFGIDRSRLKAKGFGYTRRVAYNQTEEERRKNRRVNAIIDCVVKKKEQKAEPAQEQKPDQKQELMQEKKPVQTPESMQEQAPVQKQEQAK
jgi:hypothetical protein